jgi:hypothetical protein
MNRPPAVWIFKGPSVDPDAYQPVLWGLEEEGIPWEIRETSRGELPALARQAAHGSPLDVGIAIGEGGDVVLHHRDLPAETPLFSLRNQRPKPSQLRRLGMNAARLVKRQPLAMGNDAPVVAAARHSSGNTQHHMEDIILELLVGLFTDPSFEMDDRS